MKDKIYITFDEAIILIGDVEEVHIFKQSNNILLGCNCSIESVKKGLKNSSYGIEIAGETARSIKHGIAFYDKRNQPVFVETNMEKLNACYPD